MEEESQEAFAAGEGETTEKMLKSRKAPSFSLTDQKTVGSKTLNYVEVEGELENTGGALRDLAGLKYKLHTLTGDIVDFNDEVLRFWSRLDEFMMETQKERRKTSRKKGQDNHYG